MLRGTGIEISAGVGNENEPDALETETVGQSKSPEEIEMQSLPKKLMPSVITLAIASTGVGGAYAQESGANSLEEVVVLGSRSAKPRSAADSPVPVDQCLCVGSNYTTR